MFGFGEATARRIADLAIVGENGEPLEATPFGRALLGGETVADAEVRLRRLDGTEIAALGSAAPIVAADGGPLGAVRTLHDVTAQRELERQREEFFANASHDLRTPVATIKASLDVLLRNVAADLNPVLRRMLVNVDREADRMATLVEGLLDLSRLRTGRARFRAGEDRPATCNRRGTRCGGDAGSPHANSAWRSTCQHVHSWQPSTRIAWNRRSSTCWRTPTATDATADSSVCRL